MKSKSIQPALDILDSFKNIPPREALIYCCVAVRCKTRVDELALSWRDEVCCVGVVLDEPVRADGDNDRCNTLLFVSAAAVEQFSGIFCTKMKIHRHPFSQITPPICPMP